MNRKDLQILKNKMMKTGLVTQKETSELFGLIGMLIKEAVDLQATIEKLSGQELFDNKQNSDKMSK